LAREGRQRVEALLEDEAKATSSSYLHGKEACHEVTVWQCRLKERWHQGVEREETTPVGMTRIILGQKMKKTHAVDSAATNEQ
jgi:hypothetical protein